MTTARGTAANKDDQCTKAGPGDDQASRETPRPHGTGQHPRSMRPKRSEANGRKRACQGTASRSEMAPGRQPGRSLTTRGETRQALPSRSGARRGRPRAQHAGAEQWPALGRRKRLLTAALVAAARACQRLSGASLDVPGPWMTPLRAGESGRAGQVATSVLVGRQCQPAALWVAGSDLASSLATLASLCQLGERHAGGAGVAGGDSQGRACRVTR